MAISGHVSHTGMGGFALHGGYSFISRRYGFACDSILAMRVVLADGSLISCSPEEHSDLFWAMCGAGSALGIAVEIKTKVFALPVRREVE